MSSQEIRRLITKYFGQYVKQCMNAKTENTVFITANNMLQKYKNKEINKTNDQSEVRHKLQP
jgi:hypothetical protein